MRKRPQTILGKLGILSLCFLILAGIFYWIVEEDWSRTSMTTDAVSPGISVGAAGSALEQTFEVPVDAPEEIRIMPEKVLDDEGTVEIQILREGEVLFAAEQDTREWSSGFRFPSCWRRRSPAIRSAGQAPRRGPPRPLPSLPAFPDCSLSCTGCCRSAGRISSRA